MRSRAIPYRRNDIMCLEPYCPNRLGRVFGLDQHLPKELHFDTLEGTIENLGQAWFEAREYCTGMEIVIPSLKRSGVCSQSYLYRIHRWFGAYFKCDINNLIQRGGIKATQARIHAAGLSVYPLTPFQPRKERRAEPCRVRQQLPSQVSASAPIKGKAAATASSSAVPENSPAIQIDYNDLAKIFQRPDDLEVGEGRDPLACMTPSDPAEVRRVQQYVAVQRLINPKISDAEVQMGYYAMEIDIRANKAASERSHHYQSTVAAARAEGHRQKRKPTYSGFDTHLGSTVPDSAHSLAWWFGLKPIDAERSTIRPPSPNRPGSTSASRSEHSGNSILYVHFVFSLYS
jgi:hypothetical protein